jgi:hypothetical protein
MIKIRVKGKSSFNVIVEIEEVDSFEELEYRNMDKDKSDDLIKDALANQHNIYPDYVVCIDD